MNNAHSHVHNFLSRPSNSRFGYLIYGKDLLYNPDSILIIKLLRLKSNLISGQKSLTSLFNSNKYFNMHFGE